VGLADRSSSDPNPEEVKSKPWPTGGAFFISSYNKNNLLRIWKVVYIGSPDGIRVRDA
jgi:hypothetical protein